MNHVHMILKVILILPFTHFANSASPSGIFFISESADATISLTGSAFLSCVVNTNNAKTTWRKDGIALDVESDPNLTILSNGSLLIQPSGQNSKSYVGHYQCTASIPNIGSILSRSAKLTQLLPPTYVEQPEDITVGRRQTARFSCSVDTESKPTSWYRNNFKIEADRRTTILPSGSLEIRQINEQDEGLYHCIVNELQASRRGRLVLSETAMKNVPPVFTTTPKNQIILKGTSALFECSAVGYPLPTISWLKDGVTMTIDIKLARITKLGEGNLLITNVQESDSGTYQCRAENSEDSVDISATLEINSAPTVEEKSKTMFGYEKSDVELPCKISGLPRPIIRWYKNTDMIIEGDYFQLIGDNLLILGLVSTDSGMYQCIGINNVGNIQSSIYLQVLKPGQTLPLPIPINSTSTVIDTFSPSGLMTLLTSSRFITLSWKPPLSTNGKIISYTVYYKEVESERERVLNISNPIVEEVNIQGLLPNKTYNFRVVPHGEFGVGKSSNEISVTTQTEMNYPGAPKLLKGSAISPTSIKVNWEKPEYSEVHSYQVYYSESTSEYLDSSETSEESSQSSIIETSTSTTISNLKTFTPYFIWIQALNTNGPGLTSEQIKITTLPDIPSQAPTNITIEPASTIIVVRWEPPPIATRNGIITGYKIKYKQRGKKANTLTTDGNSRFIGISELNRGMEYNIKIAALNSNGTGPFTDWLIASTFERELDESVVPDRPGNLQARANQESITITWSPPINSNVVLVRGYTIGWGKGIPDVYSKLVDGKSRYFTIEDLKSNSDYVISLRAFNNVGDGVPVYENVRTRDEEVVQFVQLSPPVGLRAVVLSPSSVVLYWTDTGLKNPGEKRVYIVRYAPAELKNFKYMNTTEQNIIVPDLRQGINYEFSVKVVKNKKSSEWSLVVYNKTGTMTTAEPIKFAPPKDLTLVAFTNVEVSTVVTSWQPPKNNIGGDVKGYLLFYTTNPMLKEWVEESINEDVLSHRVTGLTPDTNYYFKMSAKYNKGFSGFTGIKSINTPVNRGIGIRNEAIEKTGEPLLYILVTVSVAIAVVSVFCCVYYKRRRPDESPRKKLELKPPDLWIHHDQMGFKNNEKSEALLQCSKEFAEQDIEKIPLQYKNSMERLGKTDTLSKNQYRMTEFPPSGAPSQSTLNRRGSNLKSFNTSTGDPVESPQFIQGSGSGHRHNINPVPSPIHRLSTLTRREPITYPDVSNEDLSQEISNLEGLMKDLTAITASEFQC